MLEVPSKKEQLEKAYLVGFEEGKTSLEEAKVLLVELEDLVKNLGIQIGGKEIIKIRRYSPSLLVGKGKAEAILQKAKELDCDMIIFDEEISPAQQRNWERFSGLSIIDRQEVILDIFAKRAQTREAILQVELARQEYYMPRLKRAWTHLGRQKGGGAMQRSEGEKQIEVDKRLVAKRIASLKRELSKVVQHREIQRKQRMRIPLPTAAIIGYTNAGKSSLLNALTGSNILAEDKLFATLDPTTRRFKLPNGQIVLLTDTVGFVRRLPHRLIEAFKATLEEAIVADFLIHVVDISSPDVEHHMQTTLQVMEELGAKQKQKITVFNKIDLNPLGVEKSVYKAMFPDAIFISTKNRIGMDLLYEAIEEKLENFAVPMELLIPHDQYALLHQLHLLGAVKEKKTLEEGIRVVGNVPKRIHKEFLPFSVKQ